MSESRIPRTDLAATLGSLLDRAALPGLVSAYLFGSQAERRAHHESDVDIAVLLSRDVHPSPAARFQERIRLCAWLVGELRENRVDVVILNDAPPGLARRIVTTGLRVFCSAAAADRAFAHDAQLRAADLEPFLRRARRVKLAALRR